MRATACPLVSASFPKGFPQELANCAFLFCPALPSLWERPTGPKRPVPATEPALRRPSARAGEQAAAPRAAPARVSRGGKGGPLALGPLFARAPRAVGSVPSLLGSSAAQMTRRARARQAPLAVCLPAEPLKAAVGSVLLSRGFLSPP